MPFDIVLAFFAGSLIPIQGAGNRGLGEYIGSYAHAVFVSLFVSMVIYHAIRLALKTSGRAQPSPWQLVEKDRRYKYSGAPGAAYMTVFAIALTEIGPVAVPVTVLGLVTYGLITDWAKISEHKRRTIACVGAVCAVAGTSLAVFGSAGFVSYRPFDIVYVGWLLATFFCAMSIVWQFRILASMCDESSSVIAASIVSSTSGVATATLIVIGSYMFGFSPLIIAAEAWPSQPGELWLYVGGVAGVGIIPIAAYAFKRLGGLNYTVANTSGNLTAGFVIGLLMLTNPHMLFSPEVAWQFAGCLLVGFGVWVLMKKARDFVATSTSQVEPSK